MAMMKVQHINPFLNSTINLFKTMFGLEVQKSGDVYVEESIHKHRWDISGVMVLTGDAIGVLAVRLSRVLANKLLEKSGVRYESEKERERLVNGMVGELVNIIAGNASGHLEKLNVDVSVPIVVQGVNHAISWPADAPIIGIPFWTPLGPFLVNVSIAVDGRGTPNPAQ